LQGKEEIVPELDVRVTAFIPDSYIESNVSRMDAYKEIAEINSLESEKEFKYAIIDVYGTLPEETENLINIAVVKMLASKKGVSEIVVKKDEVSLAFADFNCFADQGLRSAIDEFSDCVRISMSAKPKLEFIRSGENNSDMLVRLRNFLCSAK
jgi:transcription-repair coupling factor (superfamily II helicase)